MPLATLKRLQTDPFYADVIGGEDGYTRNFGGLHTMAHGWNNPPDSGLSI
jgi:hypothetical protein